MRVYVKSLLSVANNEKEQMLLLFSCLNVLRQKRSVFREEGISVNFILLGLKSQNHIKYCQQYCYPFQKESFMQLIFRLFGEVTQRLDFRDTDLKIYLFKTGTFFRLCSSFWKVTFYYLKILLLHFTLHLPKTIFST